MIWILLVSAGPVWFRKNSKKVLLAGRRQEQSRRRKHAGNISDGLRCSTWRRAESPGKQHHLLCGGDTHGDGCTAIVHPSKVAKLQPSKLAESPSLGYLAKKICQFVHDFHPLWIARLHLPETNGEHNQLDRRHFDRILRRLQFTHPHAIKEHQRNKVIQVFSRLEISHEDYFGKQFVYSKPFKRMPTGGNPDNDATNQAYGTRMDYVFFIPPPPFYFGRRSEFQLSLDNVWYGRVLLLFQFKFKHDDGHIREEQCAMIDVLYNYADGRYHCFSAHMDAFVH